MVVRAQDSGSQLPKQRSLYSDVTFILYIGDISANDGIPFFIAPKVGQIANVTEVSIDELTYNDDKVHTHMVLASVSVMNRGKI